MKIFLEFVRNTAIGGIVFLMPLGVLIFVLKQLFGALNGFSDGLGATLFPNSEWPFLTVLISTIILIGAAFIAGLLARTEFGGSFSSAFDKFGVSNIPGYALVRDTIAGLSGQPIELAEDEQIRVVRVQQGGWTRFGVIAGDFSDTEKIVYLPGAPSAFKGSVAVVPNDQISEAAISGMQLVQSLGQLGRGLNELKQEQATHK